MGCYSVHHLEVLHDLRLTCAYLFSKVCLLLEAELAVSPQQLSIQDVLLRCVEVLAVSVVHSTGVGERSKVDITSKEL